MRESGYYPPGAEFDPMAPWNQIDVPEKDFDITCCQVLSKSVTVTTDNYNMYFDDEDRQNHFDFSDADWQAAFNENGYHTPEQLLLLFKQFLKENLSHGIVFKSPAFTKQIIKECADWTVDETEFVEDEYGNTSNT